MSRTAVSALNGHYSAIQTTNAVSNSVQAANLSSYQNLTAFTIELWIYPYSFQSNGGGRVVTYRAGNTGFLIESVSATANTFKILVGNGSTLTSSNTINLTLQWQYIAFDYNGTTIYAYLNGMATSGVALASANLGNPGVPLSMGGDGVVANGFNGAFAAVRFSKVARYGGSNFAPPTSYFTSDANTLGLWNCYEGTGTTAVDTSSHLNNANFVNFPSLPLWVPGPLISPSAQRSTPTTPRSSITSNRPLVTSRSVS